MDANEHGINLDRLTVLPGLHDAAATEPTRAGSATAASHSAVEPDLNGLLINDPSNTFLCRIRGEQGITQGIFNGDIVVVDRDTVPRAQDLILWHDGQRLQLSRPTRTAPNSVIWGTVTAVIHQYRQDTGPTIAQPACIATKTCFDWC